MLATRASQAARLSYSLPLLLPIAQDANLLTGGQRAACMGRVLY
jgi:hypothetical protein